jgi:hypothetical protein
VPRASSEVRERGGDLLAVPLGLHLLQDAPMKVFPMNDFSCHTPYASHTAWSTSESRRYGSSYFARNFRCDSTSSALMPSTVAFSPSNRGEASRREHASTVQPGVSSFG